MNNGVKTVPEVVADLKEELKEFVATRLAMLRGEWNEKFETLKLSAPVLIIGLTLLWTGWLAFTGFLICIIAEAFLPSAWAFVISFIIVAVCYAIIGGGMAFAGYRQLREKGVKPERTIRVLQQDRIWLQTEGKTQL